MPKQLTHDDFLLRVKNVFGDKYSIISKYQGLETKVKVRHICGYEWEITPKALMKRNGNCPKCNDRLKKTQEEFIEEVKTLTNNEYSVVGEYKNNREKVKIKHITCGYEWDIKASAFLHSGNRCPKCSGNIRKIRNHEDFIQEVKNIHGDKYEIVSKYKGMLHPISFVCKVHGLITVNTPQSFLKNGCGRCCWETRRKTDDQFRKELDAVHNDNLIPLESYIKYDTKIKFKCKCSHIWKATPNTILNGYGCPECGISSNGEKEIRSYLQERNLKYRNQYSHENCKGKIKLRFDFYIENKILVEYDGVQHYKPVDFGGKGMEWAKKDFKRRRELDEIKNNYCKENDVLLLRIPYWENKIDYILDQLLGYLKIVENQNIQQELIHRYLVNHPEWKYDKYLDSPI